jgi:hypothetical protein
MRHKLYVGRHEVRRRAKRVCFTLGDDRTERKPAACRSEPDAAVTQVELLESSTIAANYRVNHMSTSSMKMALSFPQ